MNLPGFRQNVKFTEQGRIMVIRKIEPGDELFTNYGPEFKIPKQNPSTKKQSRQTSIRLKVGTKQSKRDNP